MLTTRMGKKRNTLGWITCIHRDGQSRDIYHHHLCVYVSSTSGWAMAKHGHFKVRSFSPITHALSFGSPHFDLSIARAGKLRAMAAAYNNNNNNSAPVFYWSSLTRWWWSGAATAHRRESCFAWSVAQRWWPKSFKDPISPYAKMVGGGVVWCVCFILSSFIIIFKRDSPISLAPAQQVSSLHKKTLFGLESNKICF